MFKDITPLLLNPEAFAASISQLAAPYRERPVDAVVGIESRGFIFGATMALELGVGFVPVRKPGKLPYQTIAVDYELEYGKDRVEMHTDAIRAGQRVALVDDLLATGGTMWATCQLIEKLGGKIAGISFLIELVFLNGREKLKGYDLHPLIQCE